MHWIMAYFVLKADCESLGPSQVLSLFSRFTYFKAKLGCNEKKRPWDLDTQPVLNNTAGKHKL